MKLKKYMIAAALMVAGLLPMTVSAKGSAQPRVYMFGFAASFNDTIVHFTEIHPVDSAWIDKKNHFLLGRESYSLQMRQYLANHDMPFRTTVVFYDEKLSKLQKKYLKMKRLYMGDKKRTTHNDVRFIPTSDFKFKTVNMGFTTEEE